MSSGGALVLCRARFAAFGAPLLLAWRSRRPVFTVTMSVGTVATATASTLAIVSTAAASAAFAAVVFDVPAAALPTALLPLRLLLLLLEDDKPWRLMRCMLSEWLACIRVRLRCPPQHAHSQGAAMRFRVLLTSVPPHHADRLCTYAIYVRVLRVGSASALRCGPLVAEPLGLAGRCCLLPEHPVIR